MSSPPELGLEQDTASALMPSDEDVEAALNERIAQLSGLWRKHSLALVGQECRQNDPKWRETKTKLDRIQAKLADVKEVLATHRKACGLQQSADLSPSAAPETASPAAQVASTNPKVPSLQSLPKFRVGTGAIHEPREFLHRFQQALLCHHSDIDRDWHCYLPYCLPYDISEWLA
jgi:hypothetical protein